ncbi:gluconate:H+ symporter [Alloscardovia omnicolens]|uniref:Transporter, gluconate:H+ symporter family n=2 Tax=Alloscardovia omnicolens TaxID=419015 RepID=U1QW35_9BIFI|nr:gluconate:H+ symporter [Alloscardovia omnicolens]ERH31595.1 transporter, gluconate:H+ symporter family [Alloscardovia omnicolens F0580]KWZ72785.1 transporter, gluconate:H+ symporter family [Alloscardovia omnicolens]MBS6347169.1 gluconate:H+ symporter [Alloscardovia omnicolens]MDK6251861.1 gluconate:H+ symporter [Alloscardovia omnicolens]MDK6523054.1 gluconate:H+ symporter [Alloscardovia omnicolens]
MNTLILAAVLGIALIVVLIAVVKLHPFLSLLIGAAATAMIAGVPYNESLNSFTTGVGGTVSSVGLLIALGGIIGILLTRSGGADVIVDTILKSAPQNKLAWAMAFSAFIVGIPLFFEVGVVILIPIVLLVARRAKMPVIALGIPALAGLSALHAFVPPHPGPLVAIDALGANLGLTLGLGLIVAIPVVIISGPLMARWMVKMVPIMAPEEDTVKSQDAPEGKPSFFEAISVILLPVVLMLAASIVDVLGAQKTAVGKAIVWIGTPLEALTITTFFAMGLLAFRARWKRDTLSSIVGSAFGSIAGILLIVAAGGGFKQTLVDSGIGDVIAQGITQANLNPFIAGWLVAVLIRLATGSATVATVTASGIVAPLAAHLNPVELSLLVLAIGAGSIFLSHVNDAGFWLVKEYFGMTVGQTFKTWSLMETVLSVSGLIVVLIVSLFVPLIS